MLFSIGKLFGNPIQIDNNTVTRARLSYARICIEIDISKLVPEKYMLWIGGKDVLLQVKWDPIPKYCPSMWATWRSTVMLLGRSRHHLRRTSPDWPLRDRGSMRTEESRGDNPGVIHNITRMRGLERAGGPTPRATTP